MIDNFTHYICRELHVKKNDNEDGEEKIVYHYHFNGWPEHGVPKHPDRLLNFLYDVDKRYRLLSQVPLALLPSLTDNSLNISESTIPEGTGEPSNASTNEHFPPIVVQCHSGIGRTGSLIVIDMIIDQIKRKGFDCEIDIHRTVQSVRNQRSGMIQTEAQYTFIYAAVAHHINTIRVRLDAEMKSPREYTNIMLGGEYVRAYAFQPTSKYQPIAIQNSPPKNVKTNRVRFPSIVSTTFEEPPHRNRHMSDIESVESQKKHESHHGSASQRQRHATEQLMGTSLGIDETFGHTDINVQPLYPRQISLEPKFILDFPPKPNRRNNGGQH